MLAVALLVAVASGTPAGGRLDSAAWVRLEGAPALGAGQCPAYSVLFWQLSLAEGVAKAERLKSREHVDPVPFSYTDSEDRRGSLLIGQQAVPFCVMVSTTIDAR